MLIMKTGLLIGQVAFNLTLMSFPTLQGIKIVLNANKNRQGCNLYICYVICTYLNDFLGSIYLSLSEISSGNNFTLPGYNNYDIK